MIAAFAPAFLQVSNRRSSFHALTFERLAKDGRKLQVHGPTIRAERPAPNKQLQRTVICHRRVGLAVASSRWPSCGARGSPGTFPRRRVGTIVVPHAGRAMWGFVPRGWWRVVWTRGGSMRVPPAAHARRGAFIDIAQPRVQREAGLYDSHTV